MIASYIASEAKEHVKLLLASWDKRLNDYDSVTLPKTWKKVITHEKYCGPTQNWAFKRWPNERVYGTLSDDVIIRHKHALKMLEEAAYPKYITSPSDGHHTHYITMWVVGGDLARAVGCLLPEGVNHNGGEDIWNRLAVMFPKLYRPRQDLLIEHMHWAFNKAPKDSTYAHVGAASQNFPEHALKFWRENGPGIIERVSVLNG